jgi:hypothetical protein
MDGSGGEQALDGGGKGGIVGRRAIGIGPGGGTGLVEGEPFLGLPGAVVVKLVVYLAGAEGLEEIAPDLVRELAGVDGHMSNR